MELLWGSEGSAVGLRWAVGLRGKHCGAGVGCSLPKGPSPFPAPQQPQQWVDACRRDVGKASGL